MDDPNGLEAQLAQAQGAPRVDLLGQLTYALIFRQPQRALDFSREALALAQTLNDPVRLAESSLRLGACSCVSGHDEDALEHLQAALSLFRQLDDVAGQARCLVNLSASSRNLGRFLEGLNYAWQGVGTARDASLPRSQGLCLNNVGLIQTDLGDHQKALEAFLDALKLFRSIQDVSGEALCLQNLGDVYSEAGQPDTALSYYGQGLALQRQLGDSHRQIDALSGLGSAQVRLGQAEAAQAAFQEALRLCTDTHDHKFESRLQRGIGDALVLAKQPEAALAAYQRAQSLAQALNAPHDQARAALSQGQLHLNQSEQEAAEQVLNLALSLATDCGAPHDQQFAHALLSQLHERRDNLRAALWHERQHHRLERDRSTRQALHRTQALMLQVEIEQAQQAAEVQRQINVRLTDINAQLETANAQKAELLDRLQEQARYLARLSQEDGLTGLFNRRHFNEQFETELTRATRYGRSLTVVLLDIDHFKAVNDTYSHQVGDRVLQALAGLLRAGCREVDTVARFGGEEFVLLLPETSAQEALVVCERLRAAVETHPWEQVQPGLRVTISLGLASEAQMGSSALLAVADARLYQAKRLGRNRVCAQDTQRTP